MPQVVLEFLKTQRTGVFAIAMLDGTPHGATVHFAHIESPLTFIFLTSPTYQKMEPLRQGESAATFVVGTTEEVNKTLQLDGRARLEDTEALRDAYFTKFPETREKFGGDVFFTFTPTWWRFTDFHLPKDKRILTSE